MVCKAQSTPAINRGSVSRGQHACARKFLKFEGANGNDHRLQMTIRSVSSRADEAAMFWADLCSDTILASWKMSVHGYVRKGQAEAQKFRKRSAIPCVGITTQVYQ